MVATISFILPAPSPMPTVPRPLFSTTRGSDAVTILTAAASTADSAARHAADLTKRYGESSAWRGRCPDGLPVAAASLTPCASPPVRVCTVISVC